jgi:hypothetical protein
VKEYAHLYSFFNSALDGGGWSTPLPGPSIPGKSPGTHPRRGGVGLMASLDRYGVGKNLLAHQGSNPGPPSP